jgi:hypothetical protein
MCPFLITWCGRNSAHAIVIETNFDMGGISILIVECPPMHVIHQVERRRPAVAAALSLRSGLKS